jgi:uncharacterized protein YraI
MSWQGQTAKTPAPTPVVQHRPRWFQARQWLTLLVVLIALLANTPVVSVVAQAPTPQVVIAGSNGAILLTAPAGEQVASLAIGALLNATGRSADSAWLYVNTTDGRAGWVAVDQIVVFGIEKLPVVTITVPLPSTVTTTAPTTVTTTAASTIVTATTTSSVTTAIAATTVNTATATGITPQAAPANTASMSATVIVNSARLNIRSGPGVNYGIIGKAQRNESVTVLARNAASTWVKIALPGEQTGVGWVAAAYLRLTGAVAELPISAEVSAAPAAVGVTILPTVAQNTAAPAATPTPATNQPVANTSAGAATGLRGTLVFQSGPGGMIYGYNLSRGRLWQLTNGFDPAISPDGQTVAFVRAGGETGIYLINIDGSNERLIFSGRNTLAAPKWSPDGAYLVFSRGDEYIECRDIGRGQCLTDQQLLDQNPNFPLDQFPLIQQYESNLARIDRQGGNYRDLANLESARAPDWNATGIVYQSKAGLQITADAPDATSKLVTHDPFKPAYEDPDWQPNGGRILFVSRSGNHREIFAVNPDGSGMVALTAPVTTLVDELPNNVAPAWSPDGQQIVFLSNRSADNSAGAWRLWVMKADGNNQQPLPINVTINYTYGNEQLVSWGQ